MRTTAQYVALIAPEHQGAPKFVATVTIMADVLARFQVFLASLPQAFDVDTAIGVQLDAVGVRVGISRRIPVPVPNPWFSLDDPTRGLDRGVWKGPYDTGTTVDQLDDDTFRRLIYAKILANDWDGTVSGEEAIYAAYFIDPATHVFVADATISASSFTVADMRMTIGVAGKIPSTVDLAIMAQGLIGAKPEGVTVDYEVTSSNGASVFGLDADNAYVGGLDHGAWGVSPAYALAHLPS